MIASYARRTCKVGDSIRRGLEQAVQKALRTA